MALINGETWVSTEKENITLWLKEEGDELLYPAKNDLEWLNQHMLDIFERSNL